MQQKKKTTQEIFNQIGSTLRLERTQKGISVEGVYEKTRIGARILKDIEEGNMQCLPKPIFIKSFILTYAKFLGIEDKIQPILKQDEFFSNDQVVFNSFEAKREEGPFRRLFSFFRSHR